MISIRRTYLWAMMLCFTFSYFLMYVPIPAFQSMVILMNVGVLVAGYSLQVLRGSWNIPLLLMTVWMLMIQIIRVDLTGTIPMLLYMTVPGFVSFSLLSSIGYEDACNPRQKLIFTAGIVAFTVFWFIVYILSIAGQREVHNWGYANYVYMIFALFPFCCLFKTKRWQFAFVAMVTVATIISLKRTAFILLCVYALIYVTFELLHQRIRKRTFLLLSLVLVLLLGFFLFTDIPQDFFEKYLYRFAEIEKDGMGGRVEIWLAGLSMWGNSNFLSVLIGSDYTYKGLSMHNDYIEILITYGLIGFIIMMGVVYSFLQEYKLICTANQENMKKAIAYSLANFAVLMFVSHVMIYPYMMFLCTMPIGYCHGLIQERGDY